MSPLPPLPDGSEPERIEQTESGRVAFSKDKAYLWSEETREWVELKPVEVKS